MKESPAAFARRLGVHKSSVSRAIKAGRLTIVDGLLDVASSEQAWQASKTGSRPDVAARHAAARRPQGADTAPPIPQADADENEPTDTQEDAPQPGPLPVGMQRYTALRLEAQNGLLKLAILLRTHKRYPFDAVRDEALALGGTLRAALERVVDQTAPQLAMLADPQARLALLASETDKLRRSLQREMPRALRRLRAGAHKP